MAFPLAALGAAALSRVLQGVASYAFGKIVASLGITLVTYAGVTQSFDLLKDWIKSSFSQMPSDVYSILMMAGLGQAVGILVGAFAYNIAMQNINKISFLPKKK